MKIIQVIVELDNTEIEKWNAREAREKAYDKVRAELHELQYTIVGIEHVVYDEIKVTIKEV